MSEDEQDAPVAVLGLGSVLLGDDGFGPNVVALLRTAWETPSGVALVDAGTPGLGLAGYLHRRDVVILIDAVAARGVPGELRWYRGDDLRRLPMKPRVNPHDPAVQEALWIAELAGNGPQDVHLLGVVPANTEPGTTLSDAVHRAVAPAAEAIVEQLGRHGVTLTRRTRPRASEAWWLSQS